MLLAPGAHPLVAIFARPEQEFRPRRTAGPYRHTEKTLSAYKNTAYVLLGGALCKAWQLIFSCFSLCALVKRCLGLKSLSMSTNIHPLFAILEQEQSVNERILQRFIVSF